VDWTNNCSEQAVKAAKRPQAVSGYWQCRSVELGHELAVGSPCGGEVLVAFLQLETQVDGLLLQVVDLLAEGVDVGGRAEPGLAPCLFAERFGQAFLKLADAGVQPDSAFVRREQVGLQ
jgi:hypothetical protein